jgi:hypothetical protein
MGDVELSEGNVHHSDGNAKAQTDEGPSFGRGLVADREMERRSSGMTVSACLARVKGILDWVVAQFESLAAFL